MSAEAKAIFAAGSLDATQAAKRFGGSRNFWRDRMDDGTLPYSRLGSKRLIPLAAIEAALEARIVMPRSGRKKSA